MSKRNGKKNGQARQSRGVAVGHLFPVHPTSDKPDGWLLCMTPEEGDVVVLPELDRMLLDMPKSIRERLASGVWWLSEERLDHDKLRDAIAQVVYEGDWEDLTFCEDCFIADGGGKGCGVLEVEQHGFAAREPPPPTLDPDAVADMASMLLEADADGLAFELVQAAFARFCALKPRPAERSAVTMTAAEAASVLGIDASADHAEVDVAFRAATAKHHPDAGGDPEKMKRVIEAKRRMDLEASE